MTYSPLRVLVTAVGGDLGQALVKALRLGQQQLEIHGCDLEEFSVGAVFVDSYHSVPPATNTADYLKSLDSLCKSLQIKAVVPGCEPEIALLSRLGSPPKLPCGAAVVCQDSKWLELYGDKLYCRKALEGVIKLAPYADGTNHRAVKELVGQTGFPVVVKSRQSSGSRSLGVAENEQQLQAYLSEISLPLVEKYIDASGGEFSAGLFFCEKFKTAIVFKRELGPGGCSWFAENSDDQEVIQYVYRIGHATCLRGSANIQVRKSKEGCRLLEINPRFSSLVAARAICGFRDVEWSISMALGLGIREPMGDYGHIRFRRFIHELVDFGQGFQAIPEWSPRQR
jgi:carbamoyl-phosphate synthase large subunit